MTEEREIVIWLAGLVSTDGTVKNSSKSKGLAFCVYSGEPDWLEAIERKVNTIGITGLIKQSSGKRFGIAFWLWLHNPRKIALLFYKYSVESYFNPRKWKIVKSGIEYYKSTKNRSRYSLAEDTIIKTNLHLPNKEIALLLEDRDAESVAHRKMYLGWKGEIGKPNATQFLTTPFNTVPEESE
jgi:hypothetical protein